MTPQTRQRFRVGLVVNTRLQTSNTMLVKEVVARGERDAIERAVRMVQRGFPGAGWVDIEAWYVERVH